MKEPTKTDIERFVSFNTYSPANKYADGTLQGVIHKIHDYRIGTRSEMYKKLPLLIEAWEDIGLHHDLRRIFEETRWMEIIGVWDGEISMPPHPAESHEKVPADAIYLRFWTAIFDLFNLSV